MKRKRLGLCLLVEELEPRVVLSPVPFNTVNSDNWSGYSSLTSLTSPQAGSVSEVHGRWTVPSVSGKGTAYSSFWVGIDGYSSNSVEQIGTDSDLVNGVPTYYAWYEMYPNPFHKITSITVAPGDVITASVTADAANNFTLTIASGAQTPFSITISAPSAQRSSAEWIAEAPSGSFGHVLPLANFGTANFSGSSATINGTTGAIDDAHWQNTAINMVSRNGVVKATTSGLSDTTVNGETTSGFSVTWKNTGSGGGGGGGKGTKADEGDRSEAQFVQVIVDQSAPAAVATFDQAPTVTSGPGFEIRNTVPTSSTPSYPAWMVGGSVGSEVANEGNEFNAVFAPADGSSTTVNISPAIVISESGATQVPLETLAIGQAPIVDDAAIVASAPVVSEPESSMGVTTKAVSNVFLLAGAALFFGHAAMFSKSQPRKTAERELEELANR